MSRENHTGQNERSLYHKIQQKDLVYKKSQGIMLIVSESRRHNTHKNNIL
jgi:hypothetical protein